MPNNIETPTLSGYEAIDYLSALQNTYKESQPDMSTWGEKHPKRRDFYLLEHVMLLTNLATIHMVYDRDWKKQNDSIDITATGFPRYTSLRDHAIQILSVYKKEGGKPIPVISEAIEKIDQGRKNALIRRLLGNPAGEKQEWGDQISISEERMPGVLWMSLPLWPAEQTACGVKYFPHTSFVLFHVPGPCEQTDYKNLTANYAISANLNSQSEKPKEGTSASFTDQLNMYLQQGSPRKFLDKALISYHPFVYRDVSPLFLNALLGVSQTIADLSKLVYPPERKKLSDDDIRVLQEKAAETTDELALLPQELKASIQTVMKLALVNNLQWWLNWGPSASSQKERDKTIQAIVGHVVSKA